MAASTPREYPRGYRSATEYHIDQEHTGAIIRTAAYHRRDYSLSVIWFPPREHANIRLSIATPFDRPSNVGLGFLDRLPLELLHNTLFCLDMHSLFKFRQTNLRSRQTVDSLKKYQIIVSYGLNLFCALLRTRLDISLLNFYNVLCIKNCSFCGEFGGFVSLLIWKRCCFTCLKEAPETQVQTLSATRKRFRLTDRHGLDRLRPFESLPVIYTMEESMHKSRIAIVSLYQASLILEEQSETIEQSQSQSRSSERNRKFNFMGSCALPYYDIVTGNVEHGVSCAGCQLALGKDIIGTKGEKWAFEARDKVYSRDGFLQHFRWCEQAQLLWKSSDGGINKPTELPVATVRGGYFNRTE